MIKIRKIICILLCCSFLFLNFCEVVLRAEDTKSKRYDQEHSEEKTTTILAWTWADEDTPFIQNEQSGRWELGVPGASKENPLTKGMLSEFLPGEIKATLSDQTMKNIPLKWSDASFPAEGLYEGNFTLKAELPSEYRLDAAAPALSVTLELGGASMYMTQEQLNKHIVKPSEPPNVTVNMFDYGITGGVTPGNGNDLFSPKTGMKHYRDQTFQKDKTPTARFIAFAEMDDWNQGINQNHFIIFGNGIIAHAGLWNRGSGSSSPYGQVFAGTTGIVNNVLENGFPTINAGNARKKLEEPKNPDGTDKKFHYENKYSSGKYCQWELMGDWKIAGECSEIGTKTFPAMPSNVYNLSDTIINNWNNTTGKTLGKTFGTGAEQTTESLAYLFDPTVEHNLKESYTNVTGLFQLDDDGYYYYSMRQNFAELTTDEDGSNRFILYDSPATKTSGDGSVGNFLPFNKGTDVFTGESGGKLQSSINSWADKMNHYFGMTVELDFRQPINGKVNNSKNETQDMIFEFSGDDDVWVYIDDVLVLDLGGVHSEIYGTINFATGEINIGRGFDSNGKGVGIPNDPTNSPQNYKTTSLKELFAAAGKADSIQWNGETFASNSDHQLKLFYLERGNYDSSMTLRFNLMPRLFQQIKKVDQDGKPLSNVEFSLYAARQKTDADGNITYFSETDASGNKIYADDGLSALATLTTGDDGEAQFVEPGSKSPQNPAGEPFNFADRFTQGQRYYILRETATPEGYRTLPTDIVLEYESQTAMLVVKNPWESGSYASFISNITGNRNITYGLFQEEKGEVVSQPDKNVPVEEQKHGLVVAIPMLYEQKTEKWKALYGSNADGFHSILPENRTAADWRAAALTAMLYQCADSRETVPEWYLYWNEETGRLEGTLSDLPGRADRYLLNNTKGDMKMVYAIINSTALKELEITGTTSSEKYEQLRQKVNDLISKGKTVEEAVAEIKDRILNGNGENRGFYSLNTDQFNRQFSSLIYIPNERRELHVWKVDQNGIPVNGVEFSLYDNKDCTGGPISTGTTALVNGKEGVLIFTPSPQKKAETVSPGYAKMFWAQHENTVYYLKETKAPEGYEINSTVVPVHVGTYSIYADAGTPEDGITVMTEVGKLAQTMKKYAADEEVNITLRDIIATAQIQPSGAFSKNGWKNMLLEGTQVARSLNLHYGRNALIDYGIHDEDGGRTLYPYFVTDTGFITARVKQNRDALTGTAGVYGDVNNNANQEDLGEQDITGLFSLINIVLVTDQNKNDQTHGCLTVRKQITGDPEQIKNDYNRTFEFELTLTNPDGTLVNKDSKFYFYGTDKSGYISNGGHFFLHHDEEFTILGLPVGTLYEIRELLNPEIPYLAENTVFSGKIAGTEAGGATATADFINVYNTFTFRFTKTDAYEPDKVLPGAKFILYRWEGTGEPDSALIPLSGVSEGSGWSFVTQEESDAAGLVHFSSLSVGIYRLIETEAPEGYLLPESQWQFEIEVKNAALQLKDSQIQAVGDPSKKPPAFKAEEFSENGITPLAYALPNIPETPLPFTGEKQGFRIMALGAALFSTGTVLSLWFSASERRKRNTARQLR